MVADFAGVGEFREFDFQHRSRQYGAGCTSRQSGPKWPYGFPWELRHRRATLNQSRAAGSLAGGDEIDPSIDAPHRSNPERQQRFHLRAIAHERAYEIESHAAKVG